MTFKLDCLFYFPRFRKIARSPLTLMLAIDDGGSVLLIV